MSFAIENVKGGTLKREKLNWIDGARTITEETLKES